MANISHSRGHQGSFSEYADLDHSHPPLYSTSTNGSTDDLLPPSAMPVATVYSSKELVKRFPGIWFIVLYLFILVVFETMSFVLSDVLHLKILGGIDEPFALLTVLHVIVWLFTFVYDRYLYYNHNALRKYGYLMFYTKTKEIRRIPIMVFSLGNATLLLIVAFLSNHVQTGWLTLIRVFQIVVSIEVLICIISTAVYISYICTFNGESSLPDVYNQDILGGLNENNVPLEAGFRDTECLDDILERQSEMIRYLQQHNANLSKHIVELSHLLPGQPTDQQNQQSMNAPNVNSF